MKTKEQLKYLAYTMLEAIREATKSDSCIGGIPSGHLYAALMQHLTLDEYQSLLAILKRTNLVKESGHVLSAVRQ